MEESNCFLIALVSRNENRLQRLLIQSQEVLLEAVHEAPFIPEELDAHVHALLKLSKGEKSKDTSHCYKIGKEYVLDATHATLKHASGVNKTLPVRETCLLYTSRCV